MKKKPWTEARLRAFVIGGMRRMTSRWGPKYAVLNKAFVEDQINPKTNRTRKMFKCSITGKLFPASEMQIDHIDPVIPDKWGRTTTWLSYNWNELLPRLFCGENNLAAVSKAAHKIKTKKENEKRTDNKKG